MANPPVPGPAQSQKVRDALAYAKRHLSRISRPSGESYAQHGNDVATVLQEVTTDESLLAVAVLHDILMHEEGGILLMQSPLDATERRLVERMHTLRGLHIDVNNMELNRVIGAFSDDARLLLLRMAHRLNDVHHLDKFPQKRRREIAHETLHMYSAISGRLGFQRWRWQMEDICFLVLQPKIAGRVRVQFEACRQIDSATLNHARTFLQRTLKKNGIDAELDERIKGLYSTYRKMVIKKKSFEELTDRLALRILVPTAEDCYRTLGVIHSCMRPMHGKLKDYIGTPKENGYRSIHTVVYPLAGISMLPIEIQIRTPQMHQECEYGIASHGEYKEWTYALTSNASRVNLFRNLEGLRSVAKSQRAFEKALQSSFNDKRLLLFDPKNNLYHLPRPATPLDFACHVIPENCHLVRGVRINGREQSLGTLLRDGDTVEVIVGDMPIPLKEQLRSCQQNVTRQLLRQAWRTSGTTITTRSRS